MDQNVAKAVKVIVSKDLLELTAKLDTSIPLQDCIVQKFSFNVAAKIG
jgi:hypothetical protein